MIDPRARFALWFVGGVVCMVAIKALTTPPVYPDLYFDQVMYCSRSYSTSPAYTMVDHGQIVAFPEASAEIVGWDTVLTINNGGYCCGYHLDNINVSYRWCEHRRIP